MKVLKSTGSVAVVNGGRSHGIQVGDKVRVGRIVNGVWKEVTTAKITEVKEHISRIEMTDDGQDIQIEEGDVVIRSEDSVPWEPDSIKKEKSFYASDSVDFKEEKPVSNGPVLIQRGGQRSGENKKFYLGPSVGLFIPLGDMEKQFGTRLGYGGIFGFRFRKDLEVSIRFLYVTKERDWSFWNFNMLGRKTYQECFVIDFGYNILYPEKIRQKGIGNNQISMGFSGGIGLILPISWSVNVELGCLTHYYPNFGKDSGSGITLMLRFLF